MKFWSKHWKSSKQPRKQRKYVYHAPLHIRHKLLSAHLPKELREKYNRRSFPVRKGDEIEIMKVKITGYSNKASIPFKKRKAICDIADQFLAKYAPDKLAYLSLTFDTMNEIEEVKSLGINGDSFEFDFKFPNHHFTDMLISERLSVFKNALVLAIESYFRHESLDAGLLTELTNEFST